MFFSANLDYPKKLEAAAVKPQIVDFKHVLIDLIVSRYRLLATHICVQPGHRGFPNTLNISSGKSWAVWAWTQLSVEEVFHLKAELSDFELFVPEPRNGALHVVQIGLVPLDKKLSVGIFVWGGVNVAEGLGSEWGSRLQNNGGGLAAGLAAGPDAQELQPKAIAGPVADHARHEELE